METLKDATALYGFGSHGIPTVRAIAKCRANLIIGGVVRKNILILVPDEAQLIDSIVGRTLAELPFSHLEPLVSCLKLHLNTAEETTL